MRTFESGQSLCRDFYREHLEPVIGVPHSAGLLGPGSDVLGYDTERSTDHDWGPRGAIFVEESQVDDVGERITRALPETFRGWPTSFGRDGQPPHPDIRVATLSSWARGELGVDPLACEMTLADWLVIPQQQLLGVVKGVVFVDDSGELTRLRALLDWYPDDVWWWMLACQWQRLAEEEPFVQRTAEVGDDTGSAILTSRLARDSIRLALLMARQYAPYNKWLGTAFSRLADPDGLGASIDAAIRASDGGAREEHLGAAYQCLGNRFNALATDLDVDPRLRPFHDRPATVLDAERFADAALARVHDAGLRGLPRMGSIDQICDNTHLLTRPGLCREMLALYQL